MWTQGSTPMPFASSVSASRTPWIRTTNSICMKLPRSTLLFVLFKTWLQFYLLHWTYWFYSTEAPPKNLVKSFQVLASLCLNSPCPSACSVKACATAKVPTSERLLCCRLRSSRTARAWLYKQPDLVRLYTIHSRHLVTHNIMKNLHRCRYTEDHLSCAHTKNTKTRKTLWGSIPILVGLYLLPARRPVCCPPLVQNTRA